MGGGGGRVAGRDILVCEATRVEVPHAIEGCACQVKILEMWARFSSAKVSLRVYNTLLRRYIRGGKLNLISMAI